eukprot:jgi/Psemu1/307380/fgenesh1_kg.324_\
MANTMTTAPGIGLFGCFSTPRKGRDSEHWDSFKQKYPTDSFTKTSLYGNNHNHKRRQRRRRRKPGLGLSLIR